jgi:signal transduction histidine kinase
MMNLSSDMSRAIHEYLGSPRIKEIDLQKIQDVYMDAMSTLDMFEFLSNNIGILTGDALPPRKEWVWFYKSIIYKWESIRRVNAKEKGCDVVYRKSRQRVYTDPHYAELIVYNLLTNAIKYSYENTNIYVHFDRYPNLKWQCVFSVTNFGAMISGSEYEEVFNMGYRTEEAKKYYPEGSGIGLWIVKESIKRLGGSVMLCQPQRVSEYNIPLLHAYITQSVFREVLDANEYGRACRAYNKLMNENATNPFGETVDFFSWIVLPLH